MKSASCPKLDERSLGLAVLLAWAQLGVMAELQAAHSIEALTSAYEDVNNGRVFVVAHRGCWSAAPENSIASLEACIRMGVESVEIDVQLTRDREPIVFHDTTLHRMTTAQGYIADRTLSELQEVRLVERDGSIALSRFRPLVTKHRIPGLRAFLEAARGRIMINLELKSNHRYGIEDTFRAATDLVREMNMAEHIFWKIPPPARGGGSADGRADEVARRMSIEELKYAMPMIWQSERGLEEQRNDFRGLNIKAFELIGQDLGAWPIGPDGRIVGADVNRYMGVAVASRWSAGLSDELALVDPDAAWGKLLELGFDLIMTDRPEQLILYLEEQGIR